MKCMYLFFLSVLLSAQSVCIAHPEGNEDQNVKVVAKSWLGAGFFAELKNVIFNLIYRSEQNVPKRLIVDWTQEFFPYKNKPDSNGWDLYFEPIHSERVFNHRELKRPCEPIHDLNYCVQRWLRYSEFLGFREFIHERFRQYITIKPPVLHKVNTFYDKHLKGHFCIGIHVRFAAAHGAETPYYTQVTLQDYIDHAQQQWELHRGENPKIFLATDSQHVIKEFKKHFSSSQIAFTNAFRAEYNEDPHLIYEHQKYYLKHPEEFHKHKPGYFGGLMALVDCLLLSRCSIMIHSISNVVDFAAWFNPHIESIFLPQGQQSNSCQCQNVLLFFNKE